MHIWNSSTSLCMGNGILVTTHVGLLFIHTNNQDYIIYYDFEHVL